MFCSLTEAETEAPRLSHGTRLGEEKWDSRTLFLPLVHGGLARYLLEMQVLRPQWPCWVRSWQVGPRSLCALQFESHCLSHAACLVR